nr:pectin acetylesterase 8-like [Ipomoea batatas]
MSFHNSSSLLAVIISTLRDDHHSTPLLLVSLSISLACSNNHLANVSRTLYNAQGAVCLVGNPPAYYHDEEEGEDNNNWLIFLKDRVSRNMFRTSDNHSSDGADYAGIYDMKILTRFLRSGRSSVLLDVLVVIGIGQVFGLLRSRFEIKS